MHACACASFSPSLWRVHRARTSARACVCMCVSIIFAHLRFSRFLPKCVSLWVHPSPQQRWRRRLCWPQPLARARRIHQVMRSRTSRTSSTGIGASGAQFIRSAPAPQPWRDPHSPGRRASCNHVPFARRVALEHVLGERRFGGW